MIDVVPIYAWAVVLGALGLLAFLIRGRLKSGWREKVEVGTNRMQTMATALGGVWRSTHDTLGDLGCGVVEATVQGLKVEVTARVELVQVHGKLQLIAISVWTASGQTLNPKAIGADGRTLFEVTENLRRSLPLIPAIDAVRLSGPQLKPLDLQPDGLHLLLQDRSTDWSHLAVVRLKTLLEELAEIVAEYSS